jgi:CubicO group peptidase (beta-lactamase class C family)
VQPTRFFAMIILLTLLSGCGGSSGSGNSNASVVSTDAVSVAAYMDSLAQAGSFVGSVLVARGDTILLNKGYGWANIDKKIINTPQTKFRVGSNTKQFTAMAILLLEQQGRLRISDRLCNFIDACPVAWQEITLKHLLTHTSGVPDYTNFGNFPSVIGSPVSVLDLIARFKSLPLDMVPGSRWLYSNSGYVLLGYVIERTSGVAYADFLRTNIFMPLQMMHTGYDQNEITADDHARGYLTTTRQPVPLDMSEFYAAGALYSTVEDMFLWDKALTNNLLVSAAAIAPMFMPQIVCPAGGCALAGDVGYGYGWFVADEQSHRYIYHWGRIDGFISSNGFFPREQVYVIVLSNLETSNVFQSAVNDGILAINSSK